MKEIEVSEFSDDCPALLDRLDDDGLVVTKNGRPVAWVIPYQSLHEMQGTDLIGSLSHKITAKGDVYSTGLRWEPGSPS